MKIRNFFTVLLSVLILFAITANTTALAESSAAQDPTVMMKNITDQLLVKLKSDRSEISSNPNQVYNIVDQILSPHVDTIGMARTVLGRNAWGSASPAERTEFAKVFLQVVIRTYASALNAYTDQQVKYFPVRGGIGKRTRVQIQSEIIRDSGPAVQIIYRLAKVKNSWFVYDMSVEGIGLLQSFRSQIQAELSKGMSVSQLITKLKQHNANNS